MYSNWATRHRALVGCFAFLLGAVPLSAAEVIVDNSDAGFSMLSGTWTLGTANSATRYGSNYRYATTASTATAEAQWQPTIPTVGDYQVFVWYPAGSNRVADVKYRVYYNGGNQGFTVDQTVNAGQWVLLGTLNFAAGSSANGRVTITNQSAQTGRRAYADAVRFFKPEPVDLTMAVNSPGTGTTTPAVGGPYTYTQNTVVNITATPAGGYVFDHWTVSAGSNVASPTSASTTVTMDVSKTITAFFTQPVPQFRAHWADAFHAGFKSKAEIDSMISRTLAGGYNAIVAEVCAFHDNASSSHGAYWNSSIVPKAPDITTSGLPNGDPLLYLVQQAHANGIEVHCWLVAFRMCSVWPPAGNSYLAAHPELISVPLASAGGGPAPTGSDYVLDPGSAAGQDYLMSVIRELATNYEIDGVNWDYIRYTVNDGGYPANSSYAGSGLKRFQSITGRSDTPPATGDTQWNDFRRRTIDEVVRRTRMEMAAVTSNPRQPLRFTCDLICFGNAPASFASSSAYGLYSNWEFWMRQGYLDGGIPMCYDREHDSSQALWYRNWVKAALNWRYQRHVYIGQANYLNTMANSVTQMQFAYQTDDSRSANGTTNYSYYSTVDSNIDGVTENDWTWYNYVGTNLFTIPVAVPSMPWRNPATATEGSLWGRVTKAGAPVDDATVQVGALPAVKTDGAGYYVVTLIPAATGASTSYNVTASKGADSSTHNSVAVFAGDQRREDFVFGTVPLNITQQPQPKQICPGSTTNFTVAASGGGALTYKWQKNSVDLSEAGHYSGVTLATLTVSNADGNDVADYRCVVTDTISGNSMNSNPAALSLIVSVAADLDHNCAVDGNDLLLFIPCVTGAAVTYNPGGVPNGCTLTLDVNGHIAADFNQDNIVDLDDFGAIQRCLSGSGNPPDPSCMN